MANGENSALARSMIGGLGILAAAGIMGAIVMYGQLQALEAQWSAQEQHIDYLDKRMQTCENIIRRREEAFKP